MLLQRFSSCYNPFALCGESKLHFICAEVNTIYFYDPTTQTEVASSRWFGSNNDFRTLELCPGIEPKTKRKIDLSSTTPFLVSSNSTICAGMKKSHDLYIPTTMVPVTLERIDRGTELDGMLHHTYDRATITATACKRTYRKNDFGQIVSEYPAEATEQTIVFDCNHTYEDTPLAKRYDHLAEVATKAGLKLSRYEVERLARVFNITEKRTKK